MLCVKIVSYATNFSKWVDFFLRELISGAFSGKVGGINGGRKALKRK